MKSLGRLRVCGLSNERRGERKAKSGAWTSRTYGVFPAAVRTDRLHALNPCSAWVSDYRRHYRHPNHQNITKPLCGVFRRYYRRPLAKLDKRLSVDWNLFQSIFCTSWPNARPALLSRPAKSNASGKRLIVAACRCRNSCRSPQPTPWTPPTPPWR